MPAKNGRTARRAGLIIERTMAALHHDGVRHFDFSVGNYAYKRRFGVVPLPLADITAALSWRGLPYAWRDRAVRELRRHPRLAAQVKSRARQAAVARRKLERFQAKWKPVRVKKTRQSK